MALFGKKKNQANEEKNEEKSVDLKGVVLELLNQKLNGHIYDGCIIMRGGYTIEVSLGRREEKEGIQLIQFIFVVRNDDFDEPLIDPIDAQGQTEEDAAKMATEIFYGSVWHPIDQASQKKNVDVCFEGVETEETLEYLKGYGDVLVQGYYFDKPLKAEEFEEKYCRVPRQVVSD